MNLDDIKGNDKKKLDEISTKVASDYRDKAENARSALKAGPGNYSEFSKRSKGIDRADKRLSAAQGDLFSKKSKDVKEATGDEKFDRMLGKISGSTEPSTAGGAASKKVNAAANQPPDAETIEALNKMMYDMHITMQTANRLMQKLLRGR